jgi:hypothetical protein
VLEVNPLVALEAGFSGEALFGDEDGKQILMGIARKSIIRLLEFKLCHKELLGWKRRNRTS